MPATPDFTQLKAILFDLDGVLFMSNEIHARAYQMAFDAEGLSGFNHDEITGMRTDAVVALILERNQREATTEEVARVTAIKRANAKALFLEKAPAIEGCDALLKTLKAHYRLALCTSASSNTANSFLDVADHRAQFDFVITGPEVTNSKPAPEIYQRAMAEFNVQPHECLVVEDSENGVRSGIDAGAHVVGVEGTFPPEQLMQLGAFAVVRKATDLPALCGIG